MTTLKTKQPKLPYYISLILVIAVGISLAKLMWLVLSPVAKIDANIDNQNPSTTTPINPQPHNTNFGKLIADLHLFGEVKKKPVVVKTTPPVEPTKPPPAKLDLKLHGIIAYKSKRGFALISSNGKEQKVYGQGDKINDDDQVTVSKLFPEKVLINNHGTIEELLLPSNKKNKPSNNRLPQGVNPIPANAPMNRMQHKPITENSRSGGAPDLSQFRAQVLSNPQKLMDVATPSPAYNEETDEFIGFRVQPGSNRQIFRKLGFKANDIITSVNGIALDSPQKGAAVLGELQQASSITIEVKRGNQILTLSHSF
jgi:general secretion pathway protein C